MLRSSRAKRPPREGAGPLPAFLLDRTYAPVVEAERRNAPGLATLHTVVPFYNGPRRFLLCPLLLSDSPACWSLRCSSCCSHSWPRSVFAQPTLHNQSVNALQATSSLPSNMLYKCSSRGARPVHGREWGWIHLPQASRHGRGHTSHLAR